MKEFGSRLWPPYVRTQYSYMYHVTPTRMRLAHTSQQIPRRGRRDTRVCTVGVARVGRRLSVSSGLLAAHTRRSLTLWYSVRVDGLSRVPSAHGLRPSVNDGVVCMTPKERKELDFEA